MLTPASTIALVGFDSAAAWLGATLARRGCAVRAWDTALHDVALRTAMRERIAAAGIDACDDLAAALRGARLVITGEARRQLPPLSQGQTLLDLMAGDADARARQVEAAGARHVAAGIHAAGTDGVSHLLLAGPNAGGLAAALQSLGISVAVSPETSATAVAFDRAAVQHTPDPAMFRQPVLRGELP
jgi:hypothetical protein